MRLSLDIPRAREPAIAEALGSLGGRLAARIGAAHAASWFGRAVVVDVFGDTLTMQFHGKFIRDRARSDYELAVRDCCSALVPSIKIIRFTVAGRTPHTHALYAIRQIACEVPATIKSLFHQTAAQTVLTADDRFETPYTLTIRSVGAIGATDEINIENVRRRLEGRSFSHLRCCTACGTPWRLLARIADFDQQPIERDTAFLGISKRRRQPCVSQMSCWVDRYAPCRPAGAP